jgi:transposase
VKLRPPEPPQLPVLSVPQEPTITSLVHLGLVAAAVEGLGLVERIDKRLPLDEDRGVEVTHGQRVKAMIINGLGYTNSPLYLTPDFFAELDVERLVGKGVQSQHLNDYALGRTLDALFAYGTTRLFTEIAFEVALERGLLGKSLHLDTTTVLLYGEYAEAEELSEQAGMEEMPVPTYGHSKAHRRDLKQVVMSLIVTGPSSMPLRFEALSGNSSDKTNFHDSIAQFEAFNKAVQSTEDFLWVADPALYCQGKLQNAPIRWLTRVPQTVNKVKDRVHQSDDEVVWEELDDGYKAERHTDEDLGEVWVLFFSEQAYKKELFTFNKQIGKAQEKAEKALKKLSAEVFDCEEDALKAGKKWAKTLKYHEVTFTVNDFERYNKRGKPAKDAVPDRIEYKLSGIINDDLAKQTPRQDQLGRFVLATNDIEAAGQSAELMLSTYKEQQKVERSFGFVKSDEFHLDNIYLKNPSRIDALMMVMTLTLMVYNTSEYMMREKMREEEITVPNQKKKETGKPTLRWVFQLMQGIHTLKLPGRKSRVTGKTEVREKIIRLFGPVACSIYDVKT